MFSFWLYCLPVLKKTVATFVILILLKIKFCLFLLTFQIMGSFKNYVLYFYMEFWDFYLFDPNKFNIY